MAASGKGPERVSEVPGYLHLRRKKFRRVSATLRRAGAIARAQAAGVLTSSREITPSPRIATRGLTYHGHLLHQQGIDDLLRGAIAGRRPNGRSRHRRALRRRHAGPADDGSSAGNLL